MRYIYIPNFDNVSNYCNHTSKEMFHTAETVCHSVNLQLVDVHVVFIVV